MRAHVSCCSMRSLTSWHAACSPDRKIARTNAAACAASHAACCEACSPETKKAGSNTMEVLKAIWWCSGAQLPPPRSGWPGKPRASAANMHLLPGVTHGHITQVLQLQLYPCILLCGRISAYLFGCSMSCMRPLLHEAPLSCCGGSGMPGTAQGHHLSAMKESAAVRTWPLRRRRARRWMRPGTTLHPRPSASEALGGQPAHGGPAAHTAEPAPAQDACMQKSY